MCPSTRPWRAIVGVAVLGGGILLTAKTATAGLISACVSNNNGSIRIVADVSACNNNEVGLTWNALGEPGPSAALHIVRNPHKFEDTNLSNINDGTELITSALFAGAYSILAHVTIGGVAAGAQAGAVCKIELSDGVNTFSDFRSIAFQNSTTVGVSVLTITVVGTLSSDGTVRLACRDSAAQPSRWAGARMMIHKVGEATTVVQ